MIDRIDAADPDALLLLGFFLLFMGAICVYLLAERMTRKRWPQGHEHASYWGGARRINDE